MMNVSDFENYIRKGLGRALIQLRGESDKRPFRQSLIDFYTKNIYFPRSISIYDAELIRCFPDADAIAEEIAAVLLDKIRQGVGCMHMIPMLLEFGYSDTLVSIVEELYSTAYRELLHYVQISNPAEKHPLCAAQYVNSITALSYLKADRNRMKQALLDIADLFAYSEEVPIPSIYSPFFMVPSGLGKETVLELGKEVTHEHPFGEKLFSHSRITLVSDKPEFEVTAEQIFDAYKFYAYKNDNAHDMKMHIAFTNASDDVTRAVAHEILRERDMDRLVYLISFFCPPMPHVSPKRFPLDPTPLLEIAQTLQLVTYEEDARAYGIVTTFYSFFSQVCHPEVKALGKKILADPKADHYQREQAAKMVFSSNYSPEDVPAFLEYLHSAIQQEQVPCCALDNGVDLPEEVIECAFFVADSARISLVKKLLETQKMPAALREECRFDSNIYIRKLVTE